MPTMQPDITQFEAVMKIIAPLGVGGLLAAFIFLWYRRDVREYEERRQSEARERLESMRQALEQAQALTQSVTEALDRSTAAHVKAIEESAQNRQLFLDLRTELNLWRQTGGNRRRGDPQGD